MRYILRQIEVKRKTVIYFFLVKSVVKTVSSKGKLNIPTKIPKVCNKDIAYLLLELYIVNKVFHKIMRKKS